MGVALRSLSGWVKSAIPPAAKARLKDMLRRRRLRKVLDQQVAVTLDELKQALERLGVKPGQVLFVHSGADWLRSIDGGPMKVLEMLRQLVGSEGTLAMPSFPFDGMALDFARAGRFDVQRSVSRMGLVTELFRRLPGVKRSLHPTHPVCAQGPQAEALVGEHHTDVRPFGPASPFGRLEALGGSVLMIGVNTAVLTHVHVAEDMVGDAFPQRVYVAAPLSPTVVDASGEERSFATRVHNPAVSRLKSITRFEPAWERAGLMRSARAGHIELRLLDAASLTRWLTDAAARGETIYG